MKTLLKTIAFCCALAIGATGAASDVLAGPGGGGKDKVEKNSGRGNQNKDWEHGGGGHGDKDIGRGGHGGKNDNILDGHVNDLVRAGITLEAARQLALGGGYTGYKPLPPGIVKNLARGKPLPPGIAKRMVPGGMLPHLPVHPGYEWRVLGSDLVLIYTATSVIADVLHDVFH